MKRRVDGKVTEGHSSVDESMISGGSIPVAKAAGDGLRDRQLGRCAEYRLSLRHLKLLC